MSKTKNVISNSLNRTKRWPNSWHLNKNDYSMIQQQDLFLFNYIRSIIFSSNKNLEIIKIRLYRNQNLLLIDLQLVIDKNVDNLFFTNFSISVNKVFGYKKQIFLFVNQLHYMIYSNYVAIKVAKLLEKRIKFKSKSIKVFLEKVVFFCLGMKIQCSGRLNNVDMAKVSSVSFGFMPLQSINLNIDFSLIVANTNVGLQCVKVWIYK